MEKIHVLLVEDEKTLSMIIKDTLEEQGFDISTAFNGEDGLRMFYAEHPEVVVADVMMPRMDGFEMVRRIRQTDCTTPVLFLTARSGINDVVEGFELGYYLFNTVSQQLTYAGIPQELSYRESEILRRLCEHRNEVVSTQSILLELWGDDSFFNTRSLHVFITKLRHKLSKDESIRIVNVRGIGYKLIV